MNQDKIDQAIQVIRELNLLELRHVLFQLAAQGVHLHLHINGWAGPPEQPKEQAYEIQT